MSQTQLSFLLTTFAGLSTLLGCILIFINIKDQNKLIAASLSFAAGVMITVSLIDLIPEAITSAHLKFHIIPTLLFIGIFFVLGIILSMLIDSLFPVSKEKGKELYHIGLISMLAIILHNIPEGIATFMTSFTNITLGITLTIAIAMHNIPEGISISIPIFCATKSRFKALFYTFLSGASEPLGALLAYFFLRNLLNDTLMGFLYAIIAGIMIHISIYELLPTAFSYRSKKNIIPYFLAGVGVMIMSSLLF